MENTEWLQYVSDSVGNTKTDTCDSAIIPVYEQTAIAPLEPLSGPIPTPPVRISPKLWRPWSDLAYFYQQPSSHGSPFEEDQCTIVSVSTTFYPGADLSPLPPDLILISSDTVFFYVHSHQILSASDNGFKSILPISYNFSEQKGSLDGAPIIPVPETSVVLNVVLHTIYGASCAHYSPTTPVILAAVDALAKYGVSLNKYAAAGTPLHSLILSRAPMAPIEFYSMAGHYNLLDIAEPISAHLLSYPLHNISDELAEKMGAQYLKRLFFLHLGRADALKRLLVAPPQLHTPTSECDFGEQKKLTRAWSLAAAYLAWDARPDQSTAVIESALGPLGEHLDCELCKASLRDRIKQLVIQWAVIKRTI